MDFEKAKKEAQDQIDAALAEVDRLKTVAKNLEESNKRTEELFVNKEKALKASLSVVESDFANAKLNLQKIKDQISEQQLTKSNLSEDINSRREDLVTFEKLIADKKAILSSNEDEIIKAANRYSELVTNKEKELEIINNKIESANNLATVEEIKAKTTLKKLQEDITAAESALAKIDENYKLTSDETRKRQSETSLAEHNKEVAEKAVIVAEAKLRQITSEVEVQTSLLEAKKKEVETVEVELKPLLAKRIDSINFMKELENKEANLKKRYEDVGLEYK